MAHGTQLSFVRDINQDATVLYRFRNFTIVLHRVTMQLVSSIIYVEIDSTRELVPEGLQ